MTLGTGSVLFTDMVGSTEQRTQLGEDAADAIFGLHTSIVRKSVEGHNGRVVKGLRDGALAVFSASRDAVAAAVSIQQAVHSHSHSDRERAFALRIGLSVGDVGFPRRRSVGNVRGGSRPPLRIRTGE